MKKQLIRVLALILFQVSFAQVGINTTDPDQSSVLEMESTTAGVLIPRMSNTNRDNIVDPEVSLMIFNTDTNTYQYNAGTKDAPIWNNVSYNPSVKYSNTDVTTNINVVSPISAPIFGSRNWNDDTELYVVSGNEVTINNDGKYRITVNIFYSAENVAGNNSERRISVLAQLAIDGNQTGTIAATGYIRHDDNHDEASLNFTEILNINEGEILSLKVFRGGNTADATLDSAGTSNITIEKLN